MLIVVFFFFQAEDGIRDIGVTGVQTCALPILANHSFGHEPWLHRYSRAELEVELAKTEDAIVAAGAPRPLGFRGPGYSVTKDVLEVLVDRGYSYDASTLPTWVGPLARAYHNRTAPPATSGDDG